MTALSLSPEMDAVWPDHEDGQCGIPHIPLLGVSVAPRASAQITRDIAGAIARSERFVIGYHNLHSIHLFHRRDMGRFRDFYAAADLAYLDGMPLVWLGRMKGYPLTPAHRATSIDWRDELFGRAVRESWRVFWLGGTEDVAARGQSVLRAQYPGLEITARHGYFDPSPRSAACRAVVDEINDARPDLLLVGMGMPRQELWILDCLDRLTVPVIMAWGGAMDFIAGAVSTPPRWLSPLGLEWSWRLANEPKRLAGRYLVEPWTLVPHLMREMAGRGSDRPVVTVGRGPIDSKKFSDL